MKPGHNVYVQCPYCGRLVKERDILECPACLREGCCDDQGGCMPAGRNCVCPECDAGENDEADE